MGKDSRKPWGKWDLLLAEAFQILQDERCGQCGLPQYICHNDSEDIQFRMIEATCEAIARKEWHEERAGKKVRPGASVHPQPYTVSGADFSTFREPYFEELAKRRKAVESER